MKFVFGLLTLIIVLGVVYGLAFFGIIPVQKMADKSPALAQALLPLHLIKAKGRSQLPIMAAAPSPQQQALDAQKKQLDADRAQLDKDRGDWEAQKRQAAAPATSDGTPLPDNAAKLNAIYAAMAPDDLSRIFAKVPDTDVITALTQMDEKKAGKILAALPADRSARLTRQMSHPALVSDSQASPVPLPHTSL